MTTVEEVRLNVRDETEPYTFPTPTIEALLSKYGDDTNMTSFHLWLIRAGDAAKRNFKFTVDGRSVDKTLTAKECRAQAETFKDLAMLEPSDGMAEITWTNAFDPPEEG